MNNIVNKNAAGQFGRVGERNFGALFGLQQQQVPAIRFPPLSLPTRPQVPPFYLPLFLPNPHPSFKGDFFQEISSRLLSTRIPSMLPLTSALFFGGPAK